MISLYECLLHLMSYKLFIRKWNLHLICSNSCLNLFHSSSSFVSLRSVIILFVQFTGFKKNSFCFVYYLLLPNRFDDLAILYRLGNSAAIVQINSIVIIFFQNTQTMKQTLNLPAEFRASIFSLFLCVSRSFSIGMRLVPFICFAYSFLLFIV